MSFRATAWAKGQSAGSLSAKAVLLLLADMADKEGECFASQAGLAEILECSDRCVREQLGVLEERGLIRREARRRSNGSQSSSLIRLSLAGAQRNLFPPADRNEVPPVRRKDVPASGRNEVPQQAERGAGEGRNVLPVQAERGSTPTTFEPSLEPSQGTTTLSAQARAASAESGADLFGKSAPKPRTSKPAKAPPTAAELAAFEAWWASYPRRVAKKAGEDAYMTALRSGRVSEQVLLAGALGYQAECRRRATPQDKIAHPATWLNGERWNDEYAADGAPPNLQPRGRLGGWSALDQAIGGIEFDPTEH